MSADSRREFHDQLKETARSSGLLAARLALVLFPLWTAFDFALEPDHATVFAPLQVVSSSAMLVLYGLLQWHPWGREFPEPLVFLLICVLTVSIAWMIPRVEGDLEGYLLGLSLAVSASGALLVWRVRWTLATVVVAISSLALFYTLEPDHLTPHSAAVTGFCLLSAALIATFSARYHYDMRWREFSAREAAESANRAKSEFLSRMSHELRTPMNSVLGFAQLLARKSLPPDQKKAVDHILRAGRHLLNLIDEVLDIARIETNRHVVPLEAVPVRPVLDEVLHLIAPLATQRGCTLDPTIPPCPDYVVEADRQRLTQVLLNLLSNAVKYNHPGGGVRVSCTVEGERVRIGVHDTGPGIPAEKMDQLFVPFARLGAEQSGVEGTGLGLALSKNLVEAMKGQMSVQSVEGKGSTFWVDLPLAGGAAEWNANQPGVPSPARGASRDRATVLYIEENPDNLSLVQSILADRPHVRLLSAPEGEAGLALAREHEPDLVLLDLHLPGMHGEEVLRRLRADPRNRTTPVIVISADATPRQVRRLTSSGARAYLTKPIDLDRLLAAVDEGLAQRVVNG